MAVIAPFEPRFSSGFLQRANEAIGCYRTGHYLAACVMCGAAAESILLGVATAKLKDADAALKLYLRPSGRKNLVDKIVGNLAKGGLRARLETYMQVLAYWRDDAGHGRHTSIAEAQADIARLQLLRFAQFASDEWDVRTS
jgi:hypothetical protein